MSCTSSSKGSNSIKTPRSTPPSPSSRTNTKSVSQTSSTNNRACSKASSTSNLRPPPTPSPTRTTSAISPVYKNRHSTPINPNNTTISNATTTSTSVGTIINSAASASAAAYKRCIQQQNRSTPRTTTTTMTTVSQLTNNTNDSNNNNYIYSSFFDFELNSNYKKNFTSNSNAAVSSSPLTSNPVYSYLSEKERELLHATFPMVINSPVRLNGSRNSNQPEIIEVNGERGVWLNKDEELKWKGKIPIRDYKINQDPQPDIITKRSSHRVEYVQELAIRYLRPPTPPRPGDIIIRQEINTCTAPAPPLIIRQQPPRPKTPPPLVIREAPPNPPPVIGQKIITISGKKLPPPPRKVIIERLAPIPNRPQAVLIERWLPYSPMKRRVIYQRANEHEPVICKPKNVIIQWEPPEVSIKKDYKHLGVIKANPIEYVEQYGASLKPSRDLPEFVLEIRPPKGISLAADCSSDPVYELEGDVHALKLIDLDREGLGEYKSQVQRLNITTSSPIQSITPRDDDDDFIDDESDRTQTIDELGSSFSTNTAISISKPTKESQHDSKRCDSGLKKSSCRIKSGYKENIKSEPDKITSNERSTKMALSIIAGIFEQVDAERKGRLSLAEAEKLFVKLKCRLGKGVVKSCSSTSNASNGGSHDPDVKEFFRLLDLKNDNTISLSDFRNAFEKLLY